jgi:WD40 repeat protein
MITCPTCQFGYDPASSGGGCPRCALNAALESVREPIAAADFEFIAELGRGAMGSVSLARQRSLDRLVALKVIAPGQRPAEWLEARLLREARAAAQVAHPHIVTVHEVGTGPAGMFLAMEYCEGGDLRAHLQERPLAPRAVAVLGVKLADAVARAHAAGVLHRDLKPSNILLTAAGEPKITDFGLSSATQGTGELTQSGQVAGSPSYLAPELLEADPKPGPAVDVYGLGAILYECVTGRPPFTGDSTASVLAQVQWSEPVPPRALNPDAPRDLETIILKCLEKAPGVRYADAGALREDLQRFLDGRPILARPVSLAGHVWRWARRNPALAGTSAATLLLMLTVAAGSSFAAWRLDRERDRAEAGEQRAVAAEGETRIQLRTALIAQAHATRLTAREGQRFESLAALRQAAEIATDANARSEAIAALTLPDWAPRQEFNDVWADGTPHTAVTPQPDFTAFIHETDQGVFSRRTFPAGDVLWTWPGVGSPRAGTTVVSPDSRWVAARLQNDEIHVLDAATGAPVFQLTGRPFAYKTSRIWGYGTDMAFSADGTLFAATRPEGGVTIHRLPGGEMIAAWDTPEWITSLAFAHTGTRLAAGGSVQRGSNVLAVLDAATGEVVARIKPETRVEFVAWSADDRWIAAGTRPLQVHAAGDLTLRAVLPERTALHAHFLPDGRHLLTSEQIGQTRLWEIDSGRLVLSKSDSGRPGVWFAAGEPLRQWRYFTTGQVVIQALHGSGIFRPVPPPYPRYTTPSIADPLDLSSDGRWLSLGGWRQPSIYDLKNHVWRVVPPYGAGTPSASIGRFTHDGDSLVIGQSQGPLRIHALTALMDNPADRDAGDAVPGYDNSLPTAFHQPTGVLALVDYQGARYRLLDSASRKQIAEWPVSRPNFAAFSPDGRWLLAGAETGPGAAIEIRDAGNGALVRTLSTQGGGTVAWSPDGRWALASDGPNVTRLWRTADWSAGPELPAEALGAARRAVFSPDGRLLAVNENNFILLLQPDTGKVLVRLEAPEQNRFSPVLRFTPDGRTLVVPRLDGSLHLWDLHSIRAELRGLGLDWAN